MTQSKEKQNFKIGRMTYGLPGTISHEGETHYLSFEFSPNESWICCYQTTDRKQILHQVADTFNKVIRATHKVLKEIDK